MFASQLALGRKEKRKTRTNKKWMLVVYIMNLPGKGDLNLHRELSIQLLGVRGLILCMRGCRK
jgi:hypothetical protein